MTAEARAWYVKGRKEAVKVVERKNYQVNNMRDYEGVLVVCSNRGT
jgi:hypothetical protein